MRKNVRGWWRAWRACLRGGSWALIATRLFRVLVLWNSKPRLRNRRWPVPRPQGSDYYAQSWSLRSEHNGYRLCPALWFHFPIPAGVTAEPRATKAIQDCYSSPRTWGPKDRNLGPFTEDTIVPLIIPTRVALCFGVFETVNQVWFTRTNPPTSAAGPPSERS